MDKDFWSQRRVLVSGHTGFKGSWLCLWLQSLGAELRGFSLSPPTDPSLFCVASVSDGMEHFISDVRDHSAVYMHMNEFLPEVVIHLAAQPLVRRSYQFPVETFSTNVMGTVTVLEAARQCESVRSLVIVTSDKCYENREWEWGYREIDPMGGQDPYSSSKGCAELITKAYRESFFSAKGVGVATARAGNVIGGGDWAEDRLVPDVMRALEKGHVINLRNPNSIRPWQHVIEPLSGYMTLAEQLYKFGNSFAGGWNFGPFERDSRPVKWIVKRLSEIWGGDDAWTQDSSFTPNEAKSLKLDISKAGVRLGWQPRWSLDTALTKVADWHRAWIAGKDMRLECLHQIQTYLDAAPSPSTHV